MKWELTLTHRSHHQMSFVRENDRRPTAEEAYELVAENFDIDLDEPAEPQINALGWKLTTVFQLKE